MYQNQVLGISAALMLLLAGCSDGSTDPYFDTQNHLETRAERAELVNSIVPGETTLGEVVARWGGAMMYAPLGTSGQYGGLVWHGPPKFGYETVTVIMPGTHGTLSDDTVIVAAYNSEGESVGQVPS